MGRRRLSSGPPRPGTSGLPNLDNFDYESTSSRQTETDRLSPPSSRSTARAVVTVVRGADAGKVVSFDEAGITVGRATACDLVLPDPGVSRKHARIVQSGTRFLVEDLGAKNGTFVDGEVVEKREVDIGTTIQIGPHVELRLVSMTSVEERLARQLYDSSMRDALTGAYNRRYIVDRVGSEIAYARRHHGVLSLALFDFDFFKTINDTHGHATGDDVLRDTARIVGRILRNEDVLARIGGEEFAFVLRGIAHAEAVTCAERVRAAVAARSAVGPNGAVRVTISIGVSSLDDCHADATVDQLFAIADERLYAAKAGGRNCVRGRR
jgi:diguanylate cyclase (GGDEF)-like protein